MTERRVEAVSWRLLPEFWLEARRNKDRTAESLGLPEAEPRNDLLVTWSPEDLAGLVGLKPLATVRLEGWGSPYWELARLRGRMAYAYAPGFLALVAPGRGWWAWLYLEPGKGFFVHPMAPHETWLEWEATVLPWLRELIPGTKPMDLLSPCAREVGSLAPCLVEKPPTSGFFNPYARLELLPEAEALGEGLEEAERPMLSTVRLWCALCEAWVYGHDFDWHLNLCREHAEGRTICDGCGRVVRKDELWVVHPDDLIDYEQFCPECAEKEIRPPRPEERG